MYDTYIFSSQNEPLGLTFFCIHQQWVATKIIFYKPLQGLSVDRYLGISPNYTTQQYLKAQNIYVTEKKCCSSKLGEFYKCLVQKCIKMRHVKRKRLIIRYTWTGQSWTLSSPKMGGSHLSSTYVWLEDWENFGQGRFLDRSRTDINHTTTTKTLKCGLIGDL